MIARIPQFDAFLDESSDEQRTEVFAIGAFVAAEPVWQRLQKAWIDRLRQDSIDYFRTTSCKTGNGPFKELRRKCGSLAAVKKAANKIRNDLEDILLSSNQWGCVGLCIVVPDYDEIFRDVESARVLFLADHTEAAYSQMMYQITRDSRKMLSNPAVGFIIDQSSCSDKIRSAFQATKKNHPTIGKSMVSFTPLDDRVTPPLQMADLLASTIKDAYLEWNKRGKPSGFPLPAKWVSHLLENIGIWDKKFMLHTILKNLKSKKIVTGKLPLREIKISKSLRKRMRKELVKKMAADSHE